MSSCQDHLALIGLDKSSPDGVRWTITGRHGTSLTYSTSEIEVFITGASLAADALKADLG